MISRRHVVAAALVLAAALAASCSSNESTSGDVFPDSVPIGTGGTATSVPATAIAGAAIATVPGADATAAPAGDSVVASTAPAESAVTVAASTLPPTSPAAPTPDQLSFVQLGTTSAPVNLTFRANDDRLFIVSRDGFIVAMRDGVIDDTMLLDISDDITAGGEQGMLGLTFSVDGTRGYVNATNRDGDTEITEFAVGPDGVFDPASKRLVLAIDQPFGNHNGGQVRIGPDGYLYIGMGDGGSGGDPMRYALNVASLLGKILRIDPTPSGESPYSVPPDNPFIGVSGARPEIWSVGVRNPWRFSFDRVTNDLWIADVGQGAWEEIDVAWADEGGGRGTNFGWSAFEGTHRLNTDQSAEGVTPPIHEYEHGSAGCSVSGGVRYRGAAVPALYGWYVYADYCNSQVRALRIDDARTAGQEVVLTNSIPSISEVAQGPDGELYVLSVGDDTVFALRPAS